MIRMIFRSHIHIQRIVKYVFKFTQIDLRGNKNRREKKKLKKFDYSFNSNLPKFTILFFPLVDFSFFFFSNKNNHKFFFFFLESRNKQKREKLEKRVHSALIKQKKKGRQKLLGTTSALSSNS